MHQVLAKSIDDDQVFENVDKVTRLSVYLIDLSDVSGIRTLAENLECELSPDLALNVDVKS
jgi:hypothetical protein